MKYKKSIQFILLIITILFVGVVTVLAQTPVVKINNEPVLPNISFCKTEKHIHYNPTEKKNGL